MSHPRDHQRAPWWKGERGEWWVLAQLALIVAIVVAPGVGLLVEPGQRWTRVVGGSCLIVGTPLLLAGLWTLGPSRTIWPRPPADARLVTGGIYSIVRHPIYGGLVLLALGVALWRNSPLHLGLAVLLFSVLDAKARREERWLRERFPDYARYTQTARKFIPGVY